MNNKPQAMFRDGESASAAMRVGGESRSAKHCATKSGRVLIVQRRMTHYRVPFFEALRTEFDSRGCELILAYGDPTPEEATKNDGGEVDWAERLRTRYFANGRICWQPYGHLLGRSDLAIVTLENKLVYNLWAQLGQRRTRVALWGHGANLQGDPRSLRERFKRRVAKRADWWFGYTEMSRPLIEATGFPPERVTILNNTVDTAEMANLHVQVTKASMEQVRQRLGLRGSCVGIFIGSLYADKRIDLLLQAAVEIHRQVPDFELLVVGSGPQADMVRTFCTTHSWAKYAGVLKGRDKVEALALSVLMLNPGLVGLGLLDSFVCGVPMLTTDCRLHSPEIAYLRDGVNGAITAESVPAYVSAAVRLLMNPEARAALARGCLESAALYTLENMARNLADGATRCLACAPWRN